MRDETLFGGKGFRRGHCDFREVFTAARALADLKRRGGGNYGDMVVANVRGDLERVIAGAASFELAAYGQRIAQHPRGAGPEGKFRIILQAHLDQSGNFTIFSHHGYIDDSGVSRKAPEWNLYQYDKDNPPPLEIGSLRHANKIAFVRNTEIFMFLDAAPKLSETDIDQDLATKVLRAVVEAFWDTAARLSAMFEVHVSHYPVIVEHGHGPAIETVDAVWARLDHLVKVPARFEEEFGFRVEEFWRLYPTVLTPAGNPSRPRLRKVFAGTPLAEMHIYQMRDWHALLSQAIHFRVWLPGKAPPRYPGSIVDRVYYMPDSPLDHYETIRDVPPEPKPRREAPRLPEKPPVAMSLASERQRRRAEALVLDAGVAEEFGCRTALDLADMYTRIAIANDRLTLASGSYPDSLGRLRKLVPMLRTLVAKYGKA